MTAVEYVQDFLHKPRCQWCAAAGVVLLVQAGTGYTWRACPRHAPRALDLVLMVGRRPVCARCGDPMPVPARSQGGGRTKLYCGNRCRTAAHRQRPPSWAADTLHGALGVEPATAPGQRVNEPADPSRVPQAGRRRKRSEAPGGRGTQAGAAG